MLKNALPDIIITFTVGFLLFSIFFCIAAWFAYQSEQRLAFWKTTEATIHESEIIKIKSYRPNSLSFAIVWDLHLVYTYIVNGKTYTGTELSNSMNRKDAYFSPPADLQALNEKLTPNSTTTVFYNPNKPEHAYVLLNTTASRLFLNWGIILFGLFLASVLLYVRVRA